MGDNIVLAHAECNRKRGNALPTPDMVARCKAIWARAVRFTRADIERFSKDHSIPGTYAACYEWPIASGEPKFDPNTVKLR